MKLIPFVLVIVHLLYLALSPEQIYDYSSESDALLLIHRAESLKKSSPAFHVIPLSAVSGAVSVAELKKQTIPSPVLTVEKEIVFPVIIDLLLMIIYALFLSNRSLRKSVMTESDPVFVAYEKCEISRSPSKSAGSDLDRLKQFIAVEYKNSLVSLEFVESSLDLPQHRIRALLKEYLKVNFKQYITELRITEAKRLLLLDDYRIQDIALAVGYLHTTTFNHVFKETTGQTPRSFRDNRGASPVIAPFTGTLSLEMAV